MILKLKGLDGTRILDGIETINYRPAVANVQHVMNGENNTESELIIGPGIGQAHIEYRDGKPIVCEEKKIAEITDASLSIFPYNEGFLENSLVMRLFVIDVVYRPGKRKPSERIFLIIGGDPKIPCKGAEAYIMSDKGETVEILRNYWV